MSSGYSMWDRCAFSCPPSTVTIRPPPFVLTIPGPAIYCPDQPLQFEQHNPCAINNWRLSPLTNRGSSFYSRALQSGSYSSNIYRY